MIRWLVALCSALGCLLALCACSEADAGVAGQDSGVAGIEVSGEPGQPPQVAVDTPLHLHRTVVRTLEPGDGPRVSLDKVFVIQLTIVDGRTGATAVSTYDEGRTPMAVTDSEDTLFPVLTRALVGQRQGSRVLVAMASDDAYGDSGAPQYDIRPGDPLVVVADVLAVPPAEVLDAPDGTTVPVLPRLRQQLPALTTLDGEPTGLSFGAGRTAAKRPAGLVVVPLVEGDGPVVQEHDLVTLDYLGQTWGATTQFADTYDREPVTVALGADRVIAAWEKALVGRTRGSRLLVLTPPQLAFGATGNPPGIPGNASLAYVIDILGVS